MRIVYFGSSEFGIPSLDALRDSGHELVRIFTQPSHRAGRGRKCRPTPVSVWAKENNVACVEAENINSAEMLDELRACGGGLLVVIAFGQKVGEEVIGLFEKGAINVHGSVLPEYRGAAPVNKAIIDGKSESGVSIITLADKMDAGFVLGTAKTAIDPEDDAQVLHDKLANLSPLTLLEVIGRIEAGTVEYVAQDESKVTFALKLRKSDGHVDFSRPAETIVNLIRGCWPWPGAQANFVAGMSSKCYPVTISKAKAVASDERPGTFGVLDEDLNVICGKDRLKIIELKPAGKKLMTFEAFANGREIKPGDLFMSPEA